MPAEFLYILYGGTQFTSFSILNKFLSDLQEQYSFSLLPLTHLFIVGCGSGLFSTLITYPFDLLRTRHAALESKKFLTMRDSCREIYAQRGLNGFFVGVRPSLLSVVANLGVFFWSYSIARSITSEISRRTHKNVWGVEAICGFVAGATSKAVTFPLDTLRKRVQVSSQASAISMLVKHYKLHGVRGFYRGFGVSILKTAPTSALSIAIYEYTITASRKFRGLAHT